MSLVLATGSVVRRGEGRLRWGSDQYIEGKGHGVLEFQSPPGCVIPPHVHRHDDELHYVLEGSGTYTVGDQTLEAEAGSLIFLPKQVVHSLAFGAEGARWLWITKVENEGLLDEPMAIPVTEPDAQQRALEIPEELVVATFAKYGMDFLLPEEG